MLKLKINELLIQSRKNKDANGQQIISNPSHKRSIFRNVFNGIILMTPVKLYNKKGYYQQEFYHFQFCRYFRFREDRTGKHVLKKFYAH